MIRQALSALRAGTVGILVMAWTGAAEHYLTLADGPASVFAALIVGVAFFTCFDQRDWP